MIMHPTKHVSHGGDSCSHKLLIELLTEPGNISFSRLAALHSGATSIKHTRLLYLVRGSL